MIKRTTLSVFVITILFAGSIAYSQRPVYPYPPVQKSVPTVQPPVIVNRAPDPFTPEQVAVLLLNEDSIRDWRKRVEGLVTDNSDSYYTSPLDSIVIENHKNVMQNIEYLAGYLKDDKYRSALYKTRDVHGNRRLVSTASLLRLYQESILIQDALFAVHCKWRESNKYQLNESLYRNLKSEYYIFMKNSGYNLSQEQYYQQYSFPDRPGIYKGFRSDILQFIGDEILSRRNVYYDTYKILLKDLEGDETRAKDQIDEQNNYALLQKKLDDISKENDSLRAQFNSVNSEKEKLDVYIADLKKRIADLELMLPKLPSREEIYAQINQIQQKGEGTLEINIGGQPFRFVYISPGTYYVGINDGEQAAYMRKLSRNSMISVGMYTIKLNSGFFIMEDKISPQQLQAVYRAEAGNGLSWFQANESAGAATNLFQKLYNDNSTVIRLPSEIEWECAMRGKDSKKLFPWGDDDPERNPDSDVTDLNIKNAASLFAEWCIDKYESYYFPVKTDPQKVVEYNPQGSYPFLTYYIRDNESIVQKKAIVENGPEPSIRSYRGASGEDFAKGLFANRAIPMRRSNRSDQVNPAISFRYVLIPAKN